MIVMGILIEIKKMIGDIPKTLFIAFVLIMFFDVIIGTIASAKDTGLSSAKGYKGISSKIAKITLIVAIVIVAYLLDMSYMDSTIIWFFVLNELESIVESVIVLGIPLPDVVVRLFAVGKKKNENDINKATEKIENQLNNKKGDD